MNSIKNAMRESCFGLLAGLAIAAVFVFIAGENPVHVFQILMRSFSASSYDLGLTLFYTTPLIFAGLAVSVAFRAGLFNIGVEGQLTAACFSGAVAGVAFQSGNIFLSIFIILFVGTLIGALFAAIPGWLKVYQGSHEVITTMMFNFMITGVASWLTVDFFQNPETQNPETIPVHDLHALSLSDPMKQFFPDSPVSLAFPFAVIIAGIVWFILYRTRFGFQLRAVGESDTASHYSGISSKKVQIIAMAISGALAGMIVFPEVIGNVHRYRLGFSPGYGFTGIAVAFVARGNPIGVIPAALLFGILHKGTSDLDLETDHITRDFSQIIQALIILAVGSQAFWRKRVRNG